MADYTDKTSVRCSFCGKRDHNVRRMLHSPGANICDECVALCYNMLVDEGLFEPIPSSSGADLDLDDVNLLKPAEMKAVLDEYVVGQDRAKITLSVAVYNHYKRIFHPVENSDVELQKSNVLLLGPTGVGKTIDRKSVV